MKKIEVEIEEEEEESQNSQQSTKYRKEDAYLYFFTSEFEIKALKHN